MKSLLFFAASLLCTGAALAQDAQKPQPKVLSAEGGRFVFGQINDWRADQYLLDTKTGRLWQIVMRTDKDNKPTGEKVLQPVAFSNYSTDRMSLDPQ